MSIQISLQAYTETLSKYNAAVEGTQVISTDAKQPATLRYAKLEETISSERDSVATPLALLVADLLDPGKLKLIVNRARVNELGPRVSRNTSSHPQFLNAATQTLIQQIVADKQGQVQVEVSELDLQDVIDEVNAMVAELEAADDKVVKQEKAERERATGAPSATTQAEAKERREDAADSQRAEKRTDKDFKKELQKGLALQQMEQRDNQERRVQDRRDEQKRIDAASAKAGDLQAERRLKDEEAERAKGKR
jgi:hypothetical protein